MALGSLKAFKHSVMQERVFENQQKRLDSASSRLAKHQQLSVVQELRPWGPQSSQGVTGGAQVSSQTVDDPQPQQVHSAAPLVAPAVARPVVRPIAQPVPPVQLQQSPDIPRPVPPVQQSPDIMYLDPLMQDFEPTLQVLGMQYFH